jgi:glycosyltransferase involved in cell wall biosynthesis
LRILLAHNYYQHSGGEEVVFEQERRLLERAGNEVITYCRSNQEVEGLTALKRLTLVKRNIWAADTEREFSQLLTRESPDIVHVHNTFFMISPSIYGACKAQDVPVVQTLHNFRLLCPGATFFRDGKVCEECVDRSLWRGVYHGCYRDSRPATASVASMLALHRLWGTWDKLVTNYIALTEFGRDKFIAGGLPAAKIVVKPNFVDPDPGEREQSGEYALFVGRLSTEKGLSTLLQAWGRLPQHYALHIVGDGPERVSLELQTHQLGLSTVQFLGRLSHEEVIAAVKRARFLIVPSGWYETFGMCIAEAFACGTPVICSRLGAMQELVSDGRTGLHFSSGDPNDLASKVGWAWSYPNKMGAMGREARAEYEAKYTPERNYPMLMEIYRRALATYGRTQTFEQISQSIPTQECQAIPK